MQENEISIAYNYLKEKFSANNCNKMNINTEELVSSSMKIETISNPPWQHKIPVLFMFIVLSTIFSL